MPFKPFIVTQAHLDFLRENKISHSINDDNRGWLKVGATYKPGWECVTEPYICQRVGPYFNSMGAFSHSRSLFSGLATIGRYCAIGEWTKVMPEANPGDRVGMSGFDYAYASPYKMFADDMGVTFERTAVIEPNDQIIEIGHDVWIGNDARLARGIKIGTGAIIASSAVVTEDVEPYMVVAGNPAVPIKRRFSEKMCERLLASEWWQYAFTDFAGMDTLDPQRFLDAFEEAVSSGSIKPYVAPKINLHTEFARITAEQAEAAAAKNPAIMAARRQAALEAQQIAKLQTQKEAMEAAVAQFNQDLSKWVSERQPLDIPAGLNLRDPQIRKLVLPFAVVATRSNDLHQNIADLIDKALTGIFATTYTATDPSNKDIIKDLEESFDALCYVGFRRAQLVSVPRVHDAIAHALKVEFQAPGDGNRMADKDFRYLMAALAICRARFDSDERVLYEAKCVEILGILKEHATRQMTTQDVYQIIRWFAYPSRLHPKTYSRILPLAISIGEAYFADKKFYVPPKFRGMNKVERMTFAAVRSIDPKVGKFLGKKRLKSPDTILKDVAIATTIGRPGYGLATLDYLYWQRGRLTDKVQRGRLQTKMVETAIIAGNDEFYGLLGNRTFRKVLLNNKFDTYSTYIVNILQRFGRHERALKMLRRHKRSSLGLKNLEAMLLRYMGKFAEAEKVYVELHQYALTNLLSRADEKPPADRFPIMSYFWPNRQRDELEYVVAVDNLLKATPRGTSDDSLIVICPSSFSAFTQMPVHALAELKSRGCSIISLLPGVLHADKVSPDIDTNVANSIYPHYLSDKATITRTESDRWVYDPENNNIELNGINFYYTIHNTMGIIFRRYDLEWRDPIVLGHARRYQMAIEAMFDKHDRLVEFSRETGRKVRIVLTEIQQGISHAMRLIAETAGSGEHVELFHICNGFEAYHSNLVRSQSAQFQCIASVTRHPEVSLAYRPSNKVYNEWVNTAPRKLKRSPEALAYAQRIDETARSKPYDGEIKYPGRPVIVLLGKILPDLARPNDLGFLHADVKEWLADCCKFAYDNQINLLLKPHPDETKDHVSLYVNQEFIELLDDVPEKMRPVIMDRRAYPIPTLRDWADGVIMWGGNSSVELGLLKIPSMICGYYGSMDVPVGHVTPDTREKFEDFLLGKIDKKRLDQVRENTITFLSYVLHPNHTMPSAFNNRSMYNAEVWPPVLYPMEEEVQRTASRMADYILGDYDVIVPSTTGGKRTRSSDNVKVIDVVTENSSDTSISALSFNEVKSSAVLKDAPPPEDTAIDEEQTAGLELEEELLLKSEMAVHDSTSMPAAKSD